LHAVTPLLLHEIMIGAAFAILGLVSVRVLERQGRRGASLEIS
jgi:hypothetical protein